MAADIQQVADTLAAEIVADRVKDLRQLDPKLLQSRFNALWHVTSGDESSYASPRREHNPVSGIAAAVAGGGAKRAWAARCSSLRAGAGAPRARIGPFRVINEMELSPTMRV